MKASKSLSVEDETILKKQRLKLKKLVDESSETLQSIVAGNKSNMGLVSKECRLSQAYIDSKIDYDINFQNLKSFNKSLPKGLLSKWSKERRTGKNITNDAIGI